MFADDRICRCRWRLAGDCVGGVGFASVATGGQTLCDERTRRRPPPAGRSQSRRAGVRKPIDDLTVRTSDRGVQRRRQRRLSTERPANACARESGDSRGRSGCATACWLAGGGLACAGQRWLARLWLTETPSGHLSQSVGTPGRSSWSTAPELASRSIRAFWASELSSAHGRAPAVSAWFGVTPGGPNWERGRDWRSVFASARRARGPRAFGGIHGWQFVG